MKDKYHISVEYGKTWRAKCKAIKVIYGDWDESYNLLPRFLDAIKEANPANEFILCCEEFGHERMFKCVFWAFVSSIAGFQYYRPLISVDGTHLYGKYPHCLLIATTLDGNNGLFPLAFAIVESKIKIVGNDRQKGLIRAVERQFLLRNIALIWFAGRKTNIIEFDHTMELIEQQKKMTSFNTLSIDASLKNKMDTTRACRVHRYTNNMYEITMDDEKLYQYDLANMTCTCTHFQMEQIPCIHTIAVCVKINYYFNQLCGPWYTTEAYRGTYAIGFYLPKDKLYWPNMGVRVVPPITRSN
ncbi:uncharacterized protein [Aristolochia californica]|uniref:uncharacterized protein n=1 Tax=Aristolochia californica TaxID=171875 RepID=UPI0035DA2AEC